MQLTLARGPSFLPQLWLTHWDTEVTTSSVHLNPRSEVWGWGLDYPEKGKICGGKYSSLWGLKIWTLTSWSKLLLHYLGLYEESSLLGERKVKPEGSSVWDEVEAMCLRLYEITSVIKRMSEWRNQKAFPSQREWLRCDKELGTAGISSAFAIHECLDWPHK